MVALDAFSSLWCAVVCLCGRVLYSFSLSPFLTSILPSYLPDALRSIKHFCAWSKRKQKEDPIGLHFPGAISSPAFKNLQGLWNFWTFGHSCSGLQVDRVGGKSHRCSVLFVVKLEKQKSLLCPAIDLWGISLGQWNLYILFGVFPSYLGLVTSGFQCTIYLVPNWRVRSKS